MIVYLDNEYRCHTENDGTMRPVEVDGLEGMCKEYIEGMRYIPEGETWKRADGEVFKGEAMSPWKDSRELEMAQLNYELAEAQAELADADAALAELGVKVDG